MRTPTVPVLPTVLALAGALLLLLPAAPAQAHARLVASQPTAGATLDTAPEAVVLEFNEPVEAEFGQLQVAGPDGTRLDQAAPVADGVMVEVPLAPPIDAGTHTVAYRVISADGHPVEGSFTFEVTESALLPPEPEPAPEATTEPEPTAEATEEATAAPAPTPGATPEAIEAEEAAADADEGGLPLLALLVGAILLVGVAGAVLARRGGDPDAAA